MARWFSIVVVMATTVFAVSAGAMTVEQVPTPNPGGGTWVVDLPNVMTAQDRQFINQQMTALEADLGVEVAIVIVDSVRAPTPKEFATALFNHWGIGKAGIDNGLLVLLVMSERRLEMETGYGMEAILPDGWLKNMQEELMVPEFRRGDFGAGLVAGLGAVDQRLRDYPDGIGHNPDPANLPQPEREIPWWLVILGGGLATLGGAAGVGRHRERTCPECKVRMNLLCPVSTRDKLSTGQQKEKSLGSVSYRAYECPQCAFERIASSNRFFSGYSRCSACSHRTMRVNSQTIRAATTYSTGLRRITETCTHCSHHNVRDAVIPRRTQSSSSGGGSRGGGFGGGRSGGGGAGSSW